MDDWIMGDVSFGIVGGVALARSEDVSGMRLRGPEGSGMVLPGNYADLVVLCWGFGQILQRSWTTV